MASDAVTVDEVLRSALAPFEARAASVTSEMERMTSQLSLLGGTATAAVVETAEAAKGESRRDASIVPALASIGTGLGLTPLILGLARLFGGGEKQAPPPLVEFALPEPARVNAGVSERIGGGPFLIDYEQGGGPRARAAPTAQTNITVQVQAMDSRSFMDRSGDIARAVRQAMLESSVLNDVIREA